MQARPPKYAPIWEMGCLMLRAYRKVEGRNRLVTSLLMSRDSMTSAVTSAAGVPGGRAHCNAASEASDLCVRTSQ